MNQTPGILPSYRQSIVKVSPGANLLLRLSLHSQIAETLLFRPTLDAWTTSKGEIISIDSRTDPLQVYLYKDCQIEQTIKVTIPNFLQPGLILKSWLRFPAIQEEAIPIVVEIVSPEAETASQTVEIFLPVKFPLTLLSEEIPLSNIPDRSTVAIMNLLSGSIDLDKVPCRWLTAELLVILYQKGEAYAQTESGKKLLARIKPTNFFINGIIALGYGQTPKWITDSLKNMNQILGGKSFLDLWEQWLLNLAPFDRHRQDFLPSFSAKAAAVPQESAERWFEGIILGMVQISPALAIQLEDLAFGKTSINWEKDSTAARSALSDRATEAIKSLLTTQGSLDTLTARWLAAELLILLCRQGDKYAQTETGSQLLTQLKQTEFFANGVLAFSAAQIPRWIDITQKAASVSHEAIGPENKRGGLLYFGETWLKSLLPSAFLDESLVSDAAFNSFLASKDLDAENWFGRVILGLAAVSPRMGDKLKAIATGITSITPTAASEKVLFDNVLEEGGSLQL